MTKFGIVGGISFFIDFTVYYLASQFIPTYIAKSLGIVIATFVNYQFNKHWTWGQKDKNQQRFAKYMFLYLVSGLTNVAANELFLHILPQWELVLNIKQSVNSIAENLFSVKINKFIAVISATLIGMMINFLGQKLWVFTEKEN